MNAARPAPTNVTIDPLIANRWSARAIDAEKPVDHQSLSRTLEAGRWAPSCFGDEPWRFLVVDRSQQRNDWESLADVLAEGNQVWARNAPILIAVCADTRFRHNDKPNRWGAYDTGAATVSLHMQGVAEGLVVHQMGGFDKNALRDVFAIPERFDPMAVIAIGHPAPVESLSAESLIEKESAPRKRRALGEIAFLARWEQPFVDGDGPKEAAP